MLRRGLRPTLVLGLAALTLTPACEPGGVDLSFRPAVGAVYRYRYEVVAEVTSRLDGEEERRQTDRSVLDATLEVVAVDDESVQVEVTVARDAQTPRSLVVRFDRGEQLSAIDLVQGQAVGSLGSLALADLLPAIVPPAGRRLAPGDTWSAATPGTGRLDRLAVEDGREIAQVITELATPVEQDIETGGATGQMVGDQRTSGTSVYDLADGSLRRSSTRTTGRARLTIEPPSGVVSAPIGGELSYEVEVQALRIA